MKHYKYDYEQGITKISSALKTVKLTAMSTVASFVLLGGVIAPIAITHAQGGSGGGGSTSSGGSSTGGGSTSTGGSGGGGSTKPGCDAFAGANAIADTTGISASYQVATCVSGKTQTTVRLKDSSGTVVNAITDPFNNQAVFSNVVFAASYNVEFSIFSLRSNSVVGTKTVAVSTPDLGPNCATNTTITPRMGYFGVYAAIWVEYSTLNCGYGRQTAEVKITNVDASTLDADYKNVSTANMFDYEGPIVSYDTNYRFDVIIYGAMGEVLDSATSYGHTVPRL